MEYLTRLILFSMDEPLEKENVFDYYRNLKYNKVKEALNLAIFLTSHIDKTINSEMWYISFVTQTLLMEMSFLIC